MSCWKHVIWKQLDWSQPNFPRLNLSIKPEGVKAGALEYQGQKSGDGVNSILHYSIFKLCSDFSFSSQVDEYGLVMSRTWLENASMYVNPDIGIDLRGAVLNLILPRTLFVTCYLFLYVIRFRLQARVRRLRAVSYASSASLFKLRIPLTYPLYNLVSFFKCLLPPIPN